MKSASLFPGLATICALALAGCDNPPTAPVAIAPAVQYSTSSPHPFVGQTVNLVLLSSDVPEQCMDIVGGVATNQQNVQSYPCWNGPNQQWKIEAAPTSITVCNPGSVCTFILLRTRSDLVIFRSVQNPSLCLDVRAATANGGEQAQVYTCHYGSNQAFRLPPPSPSAATYGGLDTELSGFHMRLEAGSGNDPYVRQQPSDNLRRQKWEFQPVGTHFRL